MSGLFERLKSCLDNVRKFTGFEPKIGLVLGSGLGGFAEQIEQVAVVDYRDIDGFPVSTVSGHRGRFVFGYSDGVPVVAAEGRIHYYEGYSMEEAVLPVRLMGMLGAEIILLTNAAGGINKELSPGDLMAITGHISTFVPSPLIGENAGELGTRFPDMSRIYDSELAETVVKLAEQLDIPLKTGVYLQTGGPQYETPEEVRMFGSLGADAVGMSTACEAIAARHMGLRVAGLSCITNMAAGISETPLSHAEVKAAADAVSGDFIRLVSGAVSAFGGFLGA